MCQIFKCTENDGCVDMFETLAKPQPGVFFTLVRSHVYEDRLFMSYVGYVQLPSIDADCNKSCFNYPRKSREYLGCSVSDLNDKEVGRFAQRHSDDIRIPQRTEHPKALTV